MRRGRRLKNSNPKVKKPKMIDAPPKVNATGKPLSSRSKTTTKNIIGSASTFRDYLSNLILI